MNQEKRIKLRAIIIRAYTIKNNLIIMSNVMDHLKDDERNKFDNLSEGLQAAESGQKLEVAADLLDKAYDELDNALLSIEMAISEIENAIDQ